MFCFNLSPRAAFPKLFWRRNLARLFKLTWNPTAKSKQNIFLSNSKCSLFKDRDGKQI